MNNQIAAEAAGKYYDANEFFADLGGREAFIHSLKPFIQDAIEKATKDIAKQFVDMKAYADHLEIKLRADHASERQFVQPVREIGKRKET